MLFGSSAFGCAHFCIMCHSVICYYLKGSAINPHDVIYNDRGREQWAITIKKSIDFNRHTNLPYPRETLPWQQTHSLLLGTFSTIHQWLDDIFVRLQKVYKTNLSLYRISFYENSKSFIFFKSV